nr:acyltransferase family protein [Devosia submarina]
MTWGAFQPFRFILAFEILIFHSNWRLAPQGYLAVEIFFVLAGFLAASRYDRPAKKPPSSAIASTIWKIYPYYFAGVVLTLVVFPWPALPDLLLAVTMLQSTGLNKFIVNGPMWFLSCYLLVSITALLLSIYIPRQWFLAGGAVAAFAGYAMILNYSGSINFTWEVRFGFLSMGMMRAIAGFGLGAVVYAVYSAYPQLHRMPLVVATALECACISIMFYYMVFAPVDASNYLAAFLVVSGFFILLLSNQAGAVSKGLSLINGQWKFLADFSVYLFVFHGPYLRIVDTLIPGEPQSALGHMLFWTIVAGASVATGLAVNATLHISSSHAKA